MGAGVLAAALVIGAAAGFRVIHPRPGRRRRRADRFPAGRYGGVNWGLSFGEEGKTPAGNASSSQLKEYDAFYCGDEAKKTLYLTFDAGYEKRVYR